MITALDRHNVHTESIKSSRITVAPLHGHPCFLHIAVCTPSCRFRRQESMLSCSFLGYGDVALPGLLASFARITDLSLNKASLSDGYFFAAAISYAGGLILTYCALIFSLFGDNGQPALLYLVSTPSHMSIIDMFQIRCINIYVMYESQDVLMPCIPFGTVA